MLPKVGEHDMALMVLGVSMGRILYSYLLKHVAIKQSNKHNSVYCTQKGLVCHLQVYGPQRDIESARRDIVSPFHCARYLLVHCITCLALQKCTCSKDYPQPVARDAASW